MFGVFSICSIRYCDIVLAQRVAAHHDLHVLRVARQIHGALARGVAAADDEHARPAKAGASVVAAP